MTTFTDDHREDVLAYHEAGHTVAFIAYNVPLAGVTLRRNVAAPHSAGGATPVQGALKDLTIAAVTYYAGPAATDLRIAEIAPELHADAQDFSREARLYDAVQGWRCDEIACGRKPSREALPPTETVEEGIRRATKLLRPRWDAVARIAESLLETRTLSGQQAYGVAQAIPGWGE